jgi:hypothetical protein
MANIELRSYPQINGPMIARFLAETDINDLNPGSLFTLLFEAAASSDFVQEGKLLQLLRIRNVDKAQGVDLENLAAEFGVDPPRFGADPSVAFLTIGDSAFDKISSVTTAGAAAPVKGDDFLRIVNGSSFTGSGTVYIARGTPTAEVVSYSSIANLGTFWELTLTADLEKDHFVNEEVVLAQGGDRAIDAGEIVQAPGRSGVPPIDYSTQADAEIPDGENTITGVRALAEIPNANGNVGIGQISQFVTAPFATATVTNDEPATGGRDTETDIELRQRIKDHVHDLGKGTQRAIIRSVIGVSDPDEGKRVITAFLREPTDTSDGIAILFIDDGTGFEPIFSGVGVEVIVTNADGTEQFFQLQQWPVVKAQLASIGVEPFALNGGETLLLEVDGVTEEQTLSGDDWTTPGIVSAQEVVEEINNLFTTIEARAKDGKLFVTPVKQTPEFIRVGTPTSGTNANAVIRFPTTKQFTIRLYKDDVLLNQNGLEATIQSFPNNEWPPFAASETWQFNIDGIDSPLTTLTDADFAALSSSNTINGATTLDWELVINAKFIGITADAKDDGTFTITSNRGISSSASVSVIGGSLAGAIIASTATATGEESDFKFNRLSGQIETTIPLVEGQELKTGSTETAGFVETAAQATFDLTTVLGTEAKMVVVSNADDNSEKIVFAQTLGVLTFANPATDIARITGAVSQFVNVNVGDWVHLYNMPQNGIFKVIEKAGDDSWVEFLDPDPQVGSDTPDGSTKTVKFFRTKGMVQEVTFDVGAAVTDDDVTANFNDQLTGVFAEILDSGSIRVSTQRLDGEGALFIPVAAGTAENLGITEALYSSNDPHLAAVESGDLLGVGTGRIEVDTEDITDPFDDFNAVGTPFTDDFSNNAILIPYISSAEDLIRTPLVKVDSTNLTLRDEKPFQVIGLGASKYAQASGIELGENDNMVFIIDDNAAQKTYDIPMFVEATISGPSVPSIDEFDAADVTGDLLGSGDRWLGFRFEDYRVWFKAKTDLVATGANNDIRVTSQLFGPNGENMLVGVFYPTTPDNDAEALFTLDEANDDILINLVLSGGTERVTGITTSQQVFLSITGPVGGVFTYRFQFLDPVTLGTVILGDIISVKDTAFSVANRNAMVISSIDNLTDSSLTYEHRAEAQTDGDVTSGVNFVSSLVPSDPFVVGDRVEFNSITKAFVSATASTVTVPVGGAYATGGGTIDINTGNLFTYTTYTPGTGVFSGVAPDPSVFGFIGGNPVTQQITQVTGNVTVVNGVSDVDLDAVPPVGDGYDVIIRHKYIFASGAPAFAAAINDKIQVAGQVLNIDAIIAVDTFDVDNEFTFAGASAGVITRLIIEAERAVNGVTEDVTLTTADGIQIFEIASTTAQELVDAANNTAGVQDLIVAANVVGDDGSGDVTLSTADELVNGDERIRLVGGESYVQTSANASPAIRIKLPLANAPEIGETIRLVPSTPLNIRDHFRKKQISGLAVATDIDLVNGARKVQVKSKIVGGEGQVFAVGGTASGNSVVSLIGTGQTISSTRGVVTTDRSLIDLLAPGHTVKLSQPGRARKASLGTIDEFTTAEVLLAAGTRARLTFSEPLAEIQSFTHTGTVRHAVRKLAANRFRYEAIEGTFSLPAGTLANDWVFVGDGSTLIGATPAQVFASANQGIFQIRETDNLTYFDIENADGVEEIVDATSDPYLFMPYASALPGDQLVVDSDSPLSLVNQGTFIILDVIDTFTVEFTNADAIGEGPLALGAGGVNSIRVLDDGYVTYRTVESVAPNPLAPTEEARLVVSPGFDLSLLNEGQSAILEFPNKLNYPTDPVPGLSGYQYWVGLKQRAQRTVDGFEPNPVTFPGVKAAGVFIEVREPQIQRVGLNIKIKTKEGVALASVSDTIKTNIISLINSLGLGEDVILSEVVTAAQESPGVESVVLVIPELEEERITINDNAIARTSSEEVVLS